MHRIISKLNVKKATGADNISAKILNHMPVLFQISQMLLLKKAISSRN